MTDSENSTTRRGAFKAIGGAAMLASMLTPAFAQDAAPAADAPAPQPNGDLLKVRLLLNSGIAGPHAFFCLAQQRGYFRDAGLDVEFNAGDGAASVVPRIPLEGFDAGYGDMPALIKLAALSEFELVLSDSGIPPADADTLRQNGVQLRIVEI